MTRTINLFVLIFVFGCSSPKTALKQNSTVSNIAQNQYRFTISFISRGSGTDGTARKKLDQYISSFELQNSTKLDYEKINWGREGETDYCFQLAGLRQQLQQTFIKESKALLNQSQLVLFQNKIPCRTKAQ